jgi:hypothetical protein
MTQPDIEEFEVEREQRFDWATFLPKRKAWIQTLVLLPFALPVANFLRASWNFAVNAIVEEQQYLIGVLSMTVNLLLPSLFFACLFHWGWFIWKQATVTWYPQRQGLWSGVCATLTIAASFGLVGLFNQSFGVCGKLGWGGIGENLFCNLDGYGFESKSWFGVWFIVAAYCYQMQELIKSFYQSYFPRANRTDFPVMGIANGELLPHDEFGSNPLDPMATSGEE